MQVITIYPIGEIWVKHQFKKIKHKRVMVKLKTTKSQSFGHFSFLKLKA